ncbi:MAG: ABC transporter permease [Thermoplasmata archaeon]|jgi:Cu-processing system permease protein|nr:ABC transporter permease [Thermoplasmata archaeon]
MSLNPRSVYIIAKKEFADNVRSRWIVALIAIFLILTIASAFMAGGGSVGEMDLTVGVLMTISSMLVPIIAIMLGYATISGEAESGALSVVLACPVRRIEVLFGKFLGLGSVICFSILVGFGVSGMIIAGTTGHAQWGGYVAFILLTMLLGLLYLSLSISFSALLKRRVTSLGAGVVLFFWGMIFGTIWMGLYMATGGSMNDLILGDDLPNWFWFEVFLSPQDGYPVAAMLAFGQTKFLGLEFDLPSWINLYSLAFAQLLGTIIPLMLAYWWFEKRDV